MCLGPLKLSPELDTYTWIELHNFKAPELENVDLIAYERHWLDNRGEGSSLFTHRTGSFTMLLCE